MFRFHILNHHQGGVCFTSASQLTKNIAFQYNAYCIELFLCIMFRHSGFGGLGIACWPLVPKFVGSNPAEAVGFLGRKNPQHAFLRRGSKAVGPMS